MSPLKLLITLIAVLVVAAGSLFGWNTRKLQAQVVGLSEGYSLSMPVKLKVSEYYMKHGVMPDNNADIGMATARNVLAASGRRIAVNRGGVLDIDFDNKPGSGSLQFTPRLSSVTGALMWQCTSDSIAPDVLDKLKPACDFLPATPASRLMNGIASGDLATVNSLLSQGVKPDVVVAGNTPLMLAARVGDLSMVRRLLAAGAMIDNASVNTERRSPLMVAVTSNQPQIVAELLSHGASVTRQDHRGLTAMDHAVATDERLGGERYVLMISASLNPYFSGEEQVDLRLLLGSVNELGWPELVAGTPMYLVAQQFNCSTVLLEHLKTKPSYRQALHAHFAMLIERCDVSQVSAVLGSHADLDVLQSYASEKHLDRAVRLGCADVVKVMIAQRNLLA